MNTLERLQQQEALLAETQREIGTLKDSVSQAEQDLATAQGRLQQLQAQGRAADPAALGEALMLKQDLEASVDSIESGARPRLAQLAVQEEKLQGKVRDATREHDRKVFADMVAEYEILMRPAWALAEQIRAQAKKVGVALEKQSPLVEYEWRTIGGYELKPGPGAVVPRTKFDMARRAA